MTDDTASLLGFILGGVIAIGLFRAWDWKDRR